jgi:hypothetical protein
MLFVPYSPGFQKILHGPAAARPVSTYGVSVVPGNNTKGSYVQLISGASLTDDVYFVEVTIHSNFVSAVARGAILDIGYDPAGGTSYTVLIANLLCGQACIGMAGREGAIGYRYRFPLFIKSGTSLAAAASVNNATVGTMRCYVKLFCKPKNPEAVKVGSFVESLGAVTATSEGTAVTAGQASEGSWTSLGTTVRNTWWHQVGASMHNGLISGNFAYFNDLSAGAAGGELLLVDDAMLYTNSNVEAVALPDQWPLGGNVVGGATIWGRSQCSNVPDTGFTMMAYCLGG